THLRTDENLTFNQLRDKSYNFANNLKLLGARKGDIVIVCLENCYQYAIIFLGSALIDELEKALKITNAKYLIVSSHNYHIAISFATQCELIILDKHFTQFGKDFNCLIKKLEPNLIECNEKEITLDDNLLTPFSSGTTNSFKCVQLTHRNFNISTAILKQALFDKLSKGHRRVTIGTLPFYHGSGFWALCYCLLEGHQTIIMEHFHPAVLLNCILIILDKHFTQFGKDFNCLIKKLEPNLIECNEKEITLDDNLLTPFSSGTTNSFKCVQLTHRNFNISTAILKQALFDKLSKGHRRVTIGTLPFYHGSGYGMTEVVVLSHITPLNMPIDDDSYLGSCGKLLPSFEAMLIDEESGVVQKEPWKRGELLLRSEAIMKGYLNDVEETKKVIDSNKWLHTGDVMYFDSDNFYFVVDRKKDLIKVNGMQVSPTELEDILKCHKNIRDAAVVGIPDKDHGQVPKAFVVLMNDEIPNFQPADLIKYVNDRVAPYKQLRGGIQIIRELPKTPNGKLARKDLLNI
uniref:AMP-binding enzyme family protein n=1 Tax=Wuchereria bancrofti TaxID=6293 RepID=A0A1I8ESL0_WUCBA